MERGKNSWPDTLTISVMGKLIYMYTYVLSVYFIMAGKKKLKRPLTQESGTHTVQSK